MHLSPQPPDDPLPPSTSSPSLSPTSPPPLLIPRPIKKYSTDFSQSPNQQIQLFSPTKILFTTTSNNINKQITLKQLMEQDKEGASQIQKRSSNGQCFDPEFIRMEKDEGIGESIRELEMELGL